MTAAGAPRLPLRAAPAHVVHALHGYETHAAHTERVLGKAGIAFEFATAGDASLMDEETIRTWFRGEFAERPAKRSSCTLNHLLLYERIADGDAEHTLVFEDDVCFLTDFGAAMDSIEEEVAALPPGHLISLENSTLRFPSVWQTRRGKALYRATAGRCTGAYLVDRAGARAMLEHARTHGVDRPIDHWHNAVAAEGVVAIYWMHPAPVEQGSHNGILSSTVSYKARSWRRRLTWLTMRTLRSTLGRLSRQPRILEEAGA